MSERWILESRYNVLKDSARHGGMATVYQAIDIDSGNPVAIKLFDKVVMSHELTREAYQRELKSLSDLNAHNNIGKLLDFGNDPTTDAPFLVLEWLEKSLLEVIQEEPIRDWEHFYTNYGRPLLDALSFAHARDVIHRDVKPANVMFTSSGELRLVDFGISKFKSYWGGGKTFQDWKSRPYAAPEDGSFEYIDTKDIFGFSALAISCLENRELNENEDGKLIKILEEQSIADGIISALSECLSEVPADRPRSIDTLIDTLDRLTKPNASLGGDGYHTFNISLTNNAIQKLQITMGTQDRGSIENQIVQDLTEVSGFTRHPNELGKYQLIGATHEYLLVVEDVSHRYFLAIDARRNEAWRLENKRQDSLCLEATFNISKNHAGLHVQQQTLKILEALDTWEDGAEARLAESARLRTENSWRSLLRLQFDLERSARDNIDYHSFELDGNQITFNVEKGDYQSIVGQTRILSTQGSKRTYSVAITSVESNRIQAHIDYANEEEIPLKGVLSLDNFLQLSSLKKQEEALDDVLFNRAVRSDLKALLFNPAEAKTPNPVRIDNFYQNDLDDTKKRIVQTALGSPDFLVINGPPGTGKTKLIAELTLQYLAHNPEHKVLISSQTHNGLDNALEKIREVAANDIDLRAVRVARKDDPRVSPSVSDLTLEHLVDVWLESVKLSSSDYLDQWVKENNVERSDVELGLAAGRLRSSLAEYNLRRKISTSIEKELNEIETELEAAKERLTESSDVDLLAFNRDKIQQSSRDAEHDLVEARRRYRQLQKEISERIGSDAEIFENMDETELQEWEISYLSESEDHMKCKKIIELLQDWYERFGRSSDFYASFLADSKIVAATCVGIGNKGYKGVEYDLCIVDEASKATPTETLLPLSKSRRWILVGDPAQLPPYVDQAARDPRLLEKFGLSEDSLQSTLLDELIGRLPSEAKLPLGTQYRMCPAIGNLISQCFYQGDLKTGREPEIDFNKYLCVPKAVTWYCTSTRNGKTETREGRSYINRQEASEIETLLKRFNFAAVQLDRSFSVCLLSFYAAQVDVLKHLANRLSSECRNLSITVDTVDAFQGREADICIVSTTRCNNRNEFGFVDDNNRINVALSRGREALVIVGDSTFFHTRQINNPLSRVIDHINDNPSECLLEALK